MLWGTIVAAILGVVGVGLLINRGLLRAVAVALSVSATVIFTIVFSKRAATEIALTNKRVIVKEGLAQYRVTEMLLSDIENVVVEQSPAGRRLGFGTVVVREKTGKYERIDRVADPLEFQHQLKQQTAEQT